MDCAVMGLWNLGNELAGIKVVDHYVGCQKKRGKTSIGVKPI